MCQEHWSKEADSFTVTVTIIKQIVDVEKCLMLKSFPMSTNVSKKVVFAVVIIVVIRYGHHRHYHVRIELLSPEVPVSSAYSASLF